MASPTRASGSSFATSGSLANAIARSGRPSPRSQSARIGRCVGGPGLPGGARGAGGGGGGGVVAGAVRGEASGLADEGEARREGACVRGVLMGAGGVVVEEEARGQQVAGDALGERLGQAAELGSGRAVEFGGR